MDSSVNTKHSISQLEEAFGIFNQVSADLGMIYQELESSVVGLKEELAASNSARIRELTEKERLAAKLSSLMEALPGGVLVLDSQGQVREMNPAALRITGKCFVGQKWSAVIDEIAGSAPVFDGEFSLHDGTRVSITSNPFGNDGDRIMLLTDTTENYRLNNLVNREKRLAALGEMAARLAHQIRTPLSSAILYVSNLSTRLSTARVPDCQKPVKSIQTQLGQIETLVEGMLSYIKGDIVASQSFSPVALLNEVSQATALQVKAANGSIESIFHGEDFEIQGDREALFNALSNLVINAIQAAETAPRITLGLQRKKNCIELSVTDNGPGIDEHTRDQIFDPFFSTRPGGTGLGLAVVMSAVKAHGGDVSIDRAAAGGACFTLRIPTQQVVFDSYFLQQGAA